MDNYLDSSRKIIGSLSAGKHFFNTNLEENYDDYRLIDFALLRKNVQVGVEVRRLLTLLSTGAEGWAQDGNPSL